MVLQYIAVTRTGNKDNTTSGKIAGRNRNPIDNNRIDITQVLRCLPLEFRSPKRIAKLHTMIDEAVKLQLRAISNISAENAVMRNVFRYGLNFIFV